MFTLTKFSIRLKLKSIACESVNIVRRFSFLDNEQLSSNEQKYMRSVLQKTNGCILFNGSTYRWTAKQLIEQPKQSMQIEHNQIVTRLILVADKIKKYNSTLINRELLMPINNQCVEKYPEWSTDTQLFALDIWHSINGAKKFPFFEILLSDFLAKFTELKKGQALQILYYIAWSKRQFRSNDESKPVIKQLENDIGVLRLDEIVIYCLALIKSGTPVENQNLIKSLYDCLLKNDLKEFDDIGVTAVVKAVRRFSTTVHIYELKQLQEHLMLFAKEASLMSLTHIIQLGTKQRVFNRQLIQVVLQRFLNKFDKLRVKDVERALLAISVLNDKITPIEMEFLKNSQKYLLKSLNSNFIESIFRCISYLAICGVVDTQLIDWALDPKTHSHAFGTAIDQEEFPLLLIDSYAKINLEKTYRGHKLPVELCASLMPKIAEKEVTGQQSEVTTEISDILRRNGIDNLQCQVAPYISFTDIFFVYNKRTNKAVNCADRSNLPGTILRASDLHKNQQELEAIAIIPCLQRQTVFKSNRYSGIFQLKLNQLKLLGFKVIVIRRSNWILYPNDAAKRRYLTIEFSKNNIFLLNRSKVNLL